MADVIYVAYISLFLTITCIYFDALLFHGAP